MLTVYRSNRAEFLARLLSRQLIEQQPGPLETVEVMVNTWPTSRWLGEQLAKANGISSLVRREMQHLAHQLPQATAREGEPHQGTDAVGRSKLFPQPSAGWPGVDHHLHRFKRARLLLDQLAGEQASQKFSPVASVNRQQGPATPASTASVAAAPST